MKTRTLSQLAIAALAVFALAGAGPALAQRGGGGGSHGGGGGFHGGGGSFHSGGAFRGGVSGVRGAGGFRGGAYGAGRGRGYGYGWHGGYGGYGGYGWYGGAGFLGYGLLFAALPFAYDTYWWDGVPYYYADNNYYLWDSAANEYETVQPPAGLVDQAAAAAPADPSQMDVFAYPMNGQSATQQAKDRTDCRQWATAQAKAQPASHDDYLRAESACLTGKGYSVR